MKKQKRQFSTEFKRQILAEAADGRPLTDLAREHDLTVNMICRWRRQLRDQELDRAVEQAPRAEPGHGGAELRYVRELEAKLREANEKLGEMYVVVESLKKVRADFERMRRSSSFVATRSGMARSRGPAK
jgi:transposase-like protein